jgi:hypothetical protein
MHSFLAPPTIVHLRLVWCMVARVKTAIAPAGAEGKGVGGCDEGSLQARSAVRGDGRMRRLFGEALNRCR